MNETRDVLERFELGNRESCAESMDGICVTVNKLRGNTNGRYGVV